MSPRRKLLIAHGEAVDLEIAMPDGSVLHVDAAQIFFLDQRTPPEVHLKGRTCRRESFGPPPSQPRTGERPPGWTPGGTGGSPWTSSVSGSGPFRAAAGGPFGTAGSPRGSRGAGPFTAAGATGDQDIDELLKILQGAARYGASRPPPPRPPPPPRAPGWRTVLGFEESASLTVDVVRARYRELIGPAHPDRGGSHEAAVALNAAWKQAKLELER